MPIKEFTCTACEHEHDELVGLNVHDALCPKCGANSKQQFRTPLNFDWGAMGAQQNVSPEFQDRFDRVHREQKEKERRNLMEHGDVGRMPGS